MIPTWAMWGPLLLSVALGLVVGVCNAILVAWWIPEPGPGHWTERARVAWPGRQARLLTMICPPVVVLFLADALAGPVCPVPRLAIGGASAFAAFLPVWMEAGRWEGRVRGVPLPARDRIASAIAHVLLRYPHFLFVGVAASITSRAFDGHALVAGGLAIAGAAFAHAGGGLALLRLLGIARPVPGVVTHDERPVWIVPGVNAQAFALPLAGAVGYTTRLAEALAADEIEAVMRHEAGHIEEGASMRWGRAAGTLLGALLFALMRPILAWSGPAFFVLTIFVLGVRTVVRRASRRAEAHADAHASQTEPAAYARALERIYEVNLVPAVLGPHRTHPDLVDRLAAVGVTPSWPKPHLPERRGTRVAAATMLLSVFVTATVASQLRIVRKGLDEDTISTLAIAAGGGADPVARLALARFHAGDLDGSLALYRRARELEPTNPWHAANEAIVLVHLGRCDEAGRARDAAWNLRDGEQDDAICTAADQAFTEGCGKQAGAD